MQEAVTASGVSVEDSILAEIAAWNESAGVPTGTVGAVIGATLDRTDFPLGQLGGVILAPGLGAQGARPEDLGARFAGCKSASVLVSTSRDLLVRGPASVALRVAAAALSEELATVLG